MYEGGSRGCRGILGDSSMVFAFSKFSSKFSSFGNEIVENLDGISRNP